MGKKRIRPTKVSKGERRSIVAGVKEVRQSQSGVDKALNKLRAWLDGKNPWITIPGPTRKEQFIKRRANEVYGDPRYAKANLFGKLKGDE